MTGASSRRPRRAAGGAAPVSAVIADQDPGAPEVVWRAKIMREQLTGTAAIPFLQARPGRFAVGACVSCGDVLSEAPALGAGRCRSCLAAIAIIATAFLRDVPLPAADAKRMKPLADVAKPPDKDDFPW